MLNERWRCRKNMQMIRNAEKRMGVQKKNGDGHQTKDRDEWMQGEKKERDAERSE
jgi:hypothetical protein